MKESDLYAKFTARFLLKDPLAFIYKIPDTAGLGGRRPFDTFGTSQGFPFCVEFKMPGEEPTLYQKYQMWKFRQSGGVPFTYIHGEEKLDELVLRIIRERRKFHER